VQKNILIQFVDVKWCRNITLFVLILFISVKLYSQDAIFSQFYSNPLYMNPALAGTGECSRIMLHYRNQWPSYAKSFNTYSVSADRYIDALSGGVGIMLFADNAHDVINTIKASGMYAYNLKINNDMQLNAGFEVSYYQQKINWDNLVFTDMIDRNSGAINPAASAEIPADNLTRQVADFSFGLVYGYREKFYVGAAASHLTQPDLSYYSSGSESYLYRKYTLHAGGNVELTQGDYRYGRWAMSIEPTVIYQHQQNAQQLNLGFNFNIMPISLGWYFRHNINTYDAMTFMAGLKFQNFKFAYAYDYSLSELESISGGAHEISITFLTNCSKKRNKPGAIKCPEF